MTKYHACVWIDEKHAKIFEIDAGSAERSEVSDHRGIKHYHRKADHVGLGTVPMDPVMLGEVAEALRGVKAILIVGPGKARTVLAGYLNDAHPRIAANIWGIEPSDHPTDAEIVAQARAFFRAANRMHG
jgi:hypothetical protein